MERHGLLWFNTVCCLAFVLTSQVHGESATNVKRNYGGISPDDPRVLNREVACPPTCPVDCKDIQDLGNALDGPYAIYISTDGDRSLVVHCELETNGGGWLVFQRRANGVENFMRTWADYEDGFGDRIRGAEFWLGLADLHLLLAQKRYVLRVDVSEFNGSAGYAEYKYFSIAPAINKYTLSFQASSYVGTAGDSLIGNNGMQFSTIDQDNDAWTGHCARDNNYGGWWHYACTFSNLNGVYSSNVSVSSNHNVFWYHFTGSTTRPLKTAEMKFRPL